MIYIYTVLAVRHGHSIEASSDEEAIKLLKKTYGDGLLCIYKKDEATGEMNKLNFEFIRQAPAFIGDEELAGKIDELMEKI